MTEAIHIFGHGWISVDPSRADDVGLEQVVKEQDAMSDESKDFYLRALSEVRRAVRAAGRGCNSLEARTAEVIR